MTSPLRRALDDMKLPSVDELVDALARTLQTPHMTRADLQRAVDAGIRTVMLEMADRFRAEASTLYTESDHYLPATASVTYGIRNRAHEYDAAATILRTHVRKMWPETRDDDHGV